jgi:glycyl-tRNA synthetase
LDAHHEEEVRGERRVVLKLKPQLAPVKVAVFPLLRNRPEIVQKAKELANALRKDFTVWYDDTAAIGRLYRRQDEIGTPFCITVDVQSLTDNAVTIRDRDTMLQERVPLDRVTAILREKLAGC